MVGYCLFTDIRIKNLSISKNCRILIRCCLNSHPRFSFTFLFYHTRIIVSIIVTIFSHGINSRTVIFCCYLSKTKESFSLLMYTRIFIWISSIVAIVCSAYGSTAYYIQWKPGIRQRKRKIFINTTNTTLRNGQITKRNIFSKPVSNGFSQQCLFVIKCMNHIRIYKTRTTEFRSSISIKIRNREKIILIFIRNLKITWA